MEESDSFLDTKEERESPTDQLFTNPGKDVGQAGQKKGYDSWENARSNWEEKEGRAAQYGSGYESEQCIQHGWLEALLIWNWKEWVFMAT